MTYPHRRVSIAIPWLPSARPTAGRRREARATWRAVALALGASLALLGGAAPAHAQTTPRAATTAADDEARFLFEAASRAFADARYGDALARFREAYALSHRPVLLFNIGQAADRLRLDTDALAAFEAYLDALPEAPNRREVEVRVAALRRALAERAELDARAGADNSPASSQSPDIDTATPNVSASRSAGDTVRPAWAGWLALGGAAVTVAGVIPAVMSVSTRADLDARCDAARVCPLDAQAIADRGASQSLAADVLFATGGALALGFGLVWLLGGTTDESTPNLSAWCNGEGCSMSARGHF